MKKNLLIISALLLLCGCGKKTTSVNVGSFWLMPEYNQEPIESFDEAFDFIKETRDGYKRALSESTEIIINDVPYAEQREPLKLYKETTEMVEKYNVIMVTGASTTETSMHVSTTTDYYDTPMLVNVADGNSIFDETHNLSVRLTPDGKDYADFIVDNLLGFHAREELNNILFPDMPVPEYSIHAGIFFEDSSYGHSMAVDMGQALMDAGIKLDLYIPVNAESSLKVQQQLDTIDPKDFYNLDVVISIMDSDMKMEALTPLFNQFNSLEVPPVILANGFRFAFEDISYITNNVNYIRTDLQGGNCPYDSYLAALGYASGYITARVMEKAVAETKPMKSNIGSLFMSKVQKEEDYLNYIKNLRITAKEDLFSFNSVVPCIGKVSFDDHGYMENVPLHIVTQNNNTIRAVPTLEILNKIGRVVSYHLEISNEH